MNPPQPFGEFELHEVLGGGLGIVYRARRRGDERDYALKLLRQERRLDGEARARFSRELSALQMVEHPAICPLLAAGEIGDIPYFCMPFLAGRDLATYLDEVRCGAHPAPWEQAVGWIATIADAVQAAHDRGLIHRDIKPSNILVDTAGSPHLLDFGLARSEADRHLHLTRTGQVVGTPAYLSPEQLQARRGSVDERADVYGLGATLFEVLTLSPPFSAETRGELYERILGGPPPEISGHRSDLPPGLVDVVAVALSRSPRHRQPSAGAFATDLRRVLRGEAPIWQRQPWWSRFAAGLRRHSKPILAALATVALGAYAMRLVAQERVLAEVRELAIASDTIRESRERLLLVEYEQLPPPWPPHVPQLQDWVRRARAHATGDPADPVLLRAADPEARSRARRAHALALAVADVDRRLAAASTTHAVAAAHAHAWQRVQSELAADGRFPGILRPQSGLMPLGADPRSGLQEFLHLGSHAIAAPLPTRDEHGRLLLDEGSGIVFVLVPGGRAASSIDGQTAVLAPFFVAKHELTRHQHRALDGGFDPSAWPLAPVPNGELQTLRHPVDNLRFDEVSRMLQRWGLDLPTDMQFDWVVSGVEQPDTESPGPDNCLGPEDGFHLNAPVGTFAAGPCGLHDLFGNVGELVGDRFAPSKRSPRPGDGLRDAGDAETLRTVRGGWHTGARWAPGVRGSILPDQRLPQVGARPVRALEDS